MAFGNKKSGVEISERERERVTIRRGRKRERWERERDGKERERWERERWE